MAVSKLTAQFPIKCQLCNGEPNIKDKCLDCDLLMCTNCSEKIHIKFKNAKDHRVISIKELGQHSGGTTNVKYEQSSGVKDIKPELSIQSEYQTNFSQVEFIAVSLDDCLWIGEYKDKKLLQLPSSRGLQKVRLKGNKTKVVYSFNEEVNNIAITPSNDLLVVLIGDSTIKIINQHSNKLRDSVYKIDDLKSPWCIHVTRDHHVIVGGSYDETHIGLVIVMDKDGKHQTKYETDQHSEYIFPENCTPVNITSTRNGNIFVIHDSPDEKHKVLVLNGGNIIKKYTRKPTTCINTDDTSFILQDAAVTPSDNVIISEFINDTLHILNNNGYLLKCVNTYDMGIVWPFSMAITTVGHFNFLYIGCDSDKDYKEKSKLPVYKLNVT